jgi:uncharacterized protein (TIGR03437 family)
LIAAFFTLAPFCSGLMAQRPLPTVTLSWAWPEGDGSAATGFNVKRGTTSGGPYQIIASLTGTAIQTYTDVTAPGNVLVPGATYYYVVTASRLVVGLPPALAAESSPSPEASAVIPTSFVGSPISISISGIVNGASRTRAYAPGMVVSVFGEHLAPSSAANARTDALPVSLGGVDAAVNGVAAPLYYVSPGQLNVQIPYETAANETATLQINNNGRVTSQTFPVATAAPGVFADQTGAIIPNGSASRGQITTLFVTGAGALTPPIPTGAAPAPGTPIGKLPQPLQKTTVTVGGVPALIDFIGVPAGLVGVTQINFQVPDGVGIGEQSVVVTVGGRSSAPVKLNVAQ